MKSKLSRRVCLRIVLAAWGALLVSPAAAAESAGEVAIPESPAAIWSAIDASVATLSALVASGDLEEVHHHAFAVRDFARALLKRSVDLSPAAHKQVEASVGYVSTLAERLDVSGDAKDVAGTKANLEKLERVLSGIRRHYPKVGP